MNEETVIKTLKELYQWDQDPVVRDYVSDLESFFEEEAYDTSEVELVEDVERYRESIGAPGPFFTELGAKYYAYFTAKVTAGEALEKLFRRAFEKGEDLGMFDLDLDFMSVREEGQEIEEHKTYKAEIMLQGRTGSIEEMGFRRTVYGNGILLIDERDFE